MNTIEKRNLVYAKFTAERAADGARELLDSKYATSQMSEKEIAALRSCAEFLQKIRVRFKKKYDKEKAWED